MAKREYFGEAADPSTRQCEWCDATAVVAFELYKPRKKIGTATYLYVCGQHEQLGRDSAKPAPSKAAK